MVIYIGYDSSQPEAYAVCEASIRKYNGSHTIKPLIRDKLEVYNRPFQNESTEFAFTRFLVPYLSDYHGHALFCDADFMWKCDPQEIVYHANETHDVYCVQHPDFLVPSSKMNEKVNSSYPKKNWSSLMWFDNSRCKTLTPTYVNQAPAGALHEMKWATSIGSLPAEFNAMVNYYQFKEPKAVHFTDGGPWHGINDNEEYSQEWNKLYATLQKTNQ